MAYQDTFMALYTPPSKRWKERLQEMANKTFENASTYWDDVYEEIKFGTLDFKQISVRVTTLVDASTGQRINEDYRKIIFPDLDYRPPLGSRYKMNDNIWLTFTTDNVRTDTSAIYVRRCNNTMNFEDKYGNVHEEPCFIDYKTTENQLKKNDTIDVPSGRIYVTCQLNDWTKCVDVNKRFIFGGDAYKVRYTSKYDRRKTFDKESSKLLTFYADYDNKDSTDNFDLEVANYIIYDYKIECDNNITNSVGYSGKINYAVLLDGKSVDEEVEFSLKDDTDVLEIDKNGNYTLLNSGTAYVVANMKNAPRYFTEIQVDVGDFVESPYVVPDIPVVKLNKQIEYEIVCDDDLEIELDTEAPVISYKFGITGQNKFYVKNMKTTSELLHIKYYNVDRSIEGEYVIKLGGIL